MIVIQILSVRIFSLQMRLKKICLIIQITFRQLDKIIISKGKLIVYLSIIYGAISAAGLIYLLIS